MSTKGVGRREVLAGLGIAGVGVVVAEHLANRSHAVSSDRGPPAQAEPVVVSTSQAEAHGLARPDAEVEQLFGALAGGGAVAHWTVESVHGLRHGAIPVVMRDREGRRFALEIFRADPVEADRHGAPPAQAGGLAAYLSNRGHGAHATDEAQGLGARALLAVLAPRVEAGARVPSGLLTHTEHRAAHPAAVGNIPV